MEVAIRALAWFVPLALLTNSPLPVPFDPVLLAFVAAHPQHAALFVLAGTCCAGIGAALDAAFLPRAWGRLARRSSERGRAWTGRGFYAWTALVSASPIPFYLVRLAVLRARPHPLAFGAAVALGRLPRYALLAGLWKALLVPAWAAVAALSVASPLCFSRW